MDRYHLNNLVEPLPYKIREWQLWTPGSGSASTNMTGDLQMADKAKATSWTDEEVTAALMLLYSYQTEDEKFFGTTRHENGQGFNAMDADICTSMARFYQKNGFLTPKQLGFLRRTLPKYHSQLPSKLIPLPIKKASRKTSAPEVQEKSATFRDGKLVISFPYSPEMVSNVKRLDGRRWVKNKKVWEAPPTFDNLTMLRDMGFSIPKRFADVFDKPSVKVEKIRGALKGLGKTLYPYQEEGAAFVEAKNGNALIGDEMGLGKTAQALAYLHLHPNYRALVICPASLKLNWAAEAKMWLGGSRRVQVISGRERAPVTGDIVIINYDILPNKTRTRKILNKKTGKFKSVKEPIPETGWADWLDKEKFDVLILDECHYLKNRGSLRTISLCGNKTTKGLAKNIPHIIALSGTPITNRPVEFFPVLSLVAPFLFPSFWKFAQRYCGAQHNGFGWEFKGATRTEELHRKLTGTCMIRRRKKEVLKQLPTKIRAAVPIEFDKAVYQKGEDAFRTWMRGTWTDADGCVRPNSENPAGAMVNLEKLKQAAVRAKMPAAIEWIKTFLETGNKLVVFSTHSFVLDELEKMFKGAVRVDGSVTGQARYEAVRRFQEDSSTVLFLGNMKAAGVGLTLTAASDTAFLEFGWTPGDHVQAEDRVHRIGQEADSVTAHYLMCPGTIEEDIVKMIEEKSRVLDQVLDGETTGSSSIFDDLIKKLEEV